MSQKKKSSYLTKEVRFGGKKLILFSLDGVTWSSRKDELASIQERHEKEKITLNDIKGITPEGEEETTEAPEADPLEKEIVLEVDDEASAPRKRGRPAGKSKLPAPPAKLPLKVGTHALAAKSSKNQPASKKAAVASPKKRASSKVVAKSAKGKAKKKRAA